MLFFEYALVLVVQWLQTKSKNVHPPPSLSMGIENLLLEFYLSSYIFSRPGEARVCSKNIVV